MRSTVITFILLLFFPGVTEAQSILRANSFSFQEEVNIQGSQEEQYEAAYQWMLTISRPGDHFLAEMENKQIVFFGSIPLSDIRGTCPVSGSKLQFKLSMEFSRNQYVYKLDQLTHTYTSICQGNLAYSITEPLENSTLSAKRVEKVYREVETKLQDLVSTMKAAI